MVSSPDNPSPLFELNLTDEEFARNNHRFRGENKRFFDRVRNATWTILPLGVNDHFSVAILRCEKKKMPSAEGGFRTVIKDVLMADPQRNESLEQFLYMRLRLILTERRGFTFKHNNPVRMWFPTQLDHYTCGLRTFEIIRVMMMRISQSAAEAGLKDGYDPKTIWKDLSGMFCPVDPLSLSFRFDVAFQYLAPRGLLKCLCHCARGASHRTRATPFCLGRGVLRNASNFADETENSG